MDRSNSCFDRGDPEERTDKICSVIDLFGSEDEYFVRHLDGIQGAHSICSCGYFEEHSCSSLELCSFVFIERFGLRFK